MGFARYTLEEGDFFRKFVKSDHFEDGIGDEKNVVTFIFHSRPRSIPSRENVSQEITRITFFLDQGKPCMCFIDQFAYPDNIEQANYLKEMSDSMEEDKNVLELTLPIGDLVMLNNLFWLHGRAAFEKNPQLHRELLRQRGGFVKA